MSESIRKEEAHIMAVSMAVVPLLKDDVAKSFMRTLESSSLRPYTDEQRTKTNEKVKEILAMRKNQK